MEIEISHALLQERFLAAFLLEHSIPFYSLSHTYILCAITCLSMRKDAFKIMWQNVFKMRPFYSVEGNRDI